MAITVFPNALREKLGSDNKYPHVRFTPVSGEGHVDNNLEFEAVHLYMPQGIAVGDSANYAGVDLGMIKAGESFANQFKAAGDVSALSKDGVITDKGAFVAGIKLLDKVGVDATALQKAQMDAGLAFNPQTALAFENMNLRTFSFAFTLVPESKKESQDMEDIERFFRKYMYPEVTGFVASYPSRFRIQFFEGKKENPFYPIIYDCFLAGMDVEVNPEGNSYLKFDDDFSAPTSKKMTLNFSETRQLSRNDLFSSRLEYNYDGRKQNTTTSTKGD